MAKWRIGLAALTLAVVGLAPPALAQTYAPTFDLVVSGTIVQVTHAQTFDYGAHPPSASIVAQLHNGPNPECVFTATRSDTGASQYQDIGGSNGYDTTGHYTDPPPVVLPLPVPIVWTLTLACGQAGTIRATVSTELPPPPPPPPSPSPAAGPTTHATQPATPASPPRPTPSTKRTPSVLGQATSRAPGQGSPAPSPSIPVSTPIVVTETPTAPAPVAAPSPSPSASPSRSPSGSHLGAPRGPRGHGPDFLRFFLIAVGAVVALIAILYAAGLRWVRVDEEPEDG
ncbi:MAG TPA: hypothetical protein VG779_04950 [Actinomycetota bacterium]|nr:hypothetical protein [Actinomycetota bacterium]